MEPIFIDKLYKDISLEEKNKIGENYFICRHTGDSKGYPYFEYLVVYNLNSGILIARFKEKKIAEEYVIWKNT